MNSILYYILYAYAYLYAILPLRVLYVFSDILFLFIFYLVRYRREITGKNLRNAFPDKSADELYKIEKDFYHHFCDYVFETIKMLHISDAEMKRRMKFINMEAVQDIMTYNSGLMMLGHYGNWEWVSSITMWMAADNPVLLGQIYRPLKNKAVDKFFLNLRKRFHSVGIPKNNTLRAIIKMKQDKQRYLVGFMSDQKPSENNMHYWTTFLNQETSMLTGAERIAKQTGNAVMYLDVRKVRRGYYEGEVKIIAVEPGVTGESEITESYTRLMEETILRDPACWLWTHNRWKYKRKQIV